MQQGRGGMGSHKHGISGHSGPSPRTKLMTCLENNRWLQSRKRRPKPIMFGSVAEAFASVGKQACKK